MKKPLTLAVLISGNGSNLQAIIDAINNGLAANITIVISNKSDAYGLVRAKKANIPTAVIRSSKNRYDDEAKLMACLAKYQPDLILMAGYMRILTPEFIKHFPNKVLNIHPSLLPRYQGLNTHERVLAAGEKEHGCSVHIVTEELDCGPIIAKSSLTINSDETAEQLQQRVHKLEHYLYPKIIEYFAEGKLQFSDDKLCFEGKPLPPKGLTILEKSG